MYFQIDGSNVRVAGTWHAIPTEDIPRWLQDAYRWAQALVIEHDICVPILAYGKRADATSLSMNQIAALSKLWDRDQGRIEEFKLWAVHMAAVGRLCRQQRSLWIEQWMRLRAEEDSKAMSYLEEVEQVAGLLDQVPERVFLEAIENLIREPETIRMQSITACHAWMSRRMDRLCAVANDLPVFQDPEFHHAALVTRNRNWIPEVLTKLRTGKRTVIMVGAYHLCGKENVAELLEQSGHSVSWLL